MNKIVDIVNQCLLDHIVVPSNEAMWISMVLEEHHQAKSKEEAEVRYDIAIDHMNDATGYGIHWLQRSNDWLKALRLAAFGKEDEG